MTWAVICHRLQLDISKGWNIGGGRKQTVVLKQISSCLLDFDVEARRDASQNLSSTWSQHVSRAILQLWSKANGIRKAHLELSLCRSRSLPSCTVLKFVFPSMGPSGHWFPHIDTIICLNATSATFHSNFLIIFACISSFSFVEDVFPCIILPSLRMLRPSGDMGYYLRVHSVVCCFFSIVVQYSFRVDTHERVRTALSVIWRTVRVVVI